MPTLTDPLPYGLREVWIYPITGDTVGTGIKFPRGRTFSFSESEDYTDLRGDDGLVATHGQGPAVDWSLENGGLNFAAIKAMYGGTIYSSGTTPDQKVQYDKKGGDARPYFLVAGRAVSDSGGDVTMVVYKAKCTGTLTGEMSDGNFWLTGSTGKGLPNADDNLYSFIQNETATPLTSTAPVAGTP